MLKAVSIGYSMAKKIVLGVLFVLGVYVASLIVMEILLAYSVLPFQD